MHDDIAKCWLFMEIDFENFDFNKALNNSKLNWIKKECAFDVEYVPVAFLFLLYNFNKIIINYIKNIV